MDLSLFKLFIHLPQILLYDNIHHFLFQVKYNTQQSPHTDHPHPTASTLPSHLPPHRQTPKLDPPIPRHPRSRQPPPRNSPPHRRRPHHRRKCRSLHVSPRIHVSPSSPPPHIHTHIHTYKKPPFPNPPIHPSHAPLTSPPPNATSQTSTHHLQGHRLTHNAISILLFQPPSQPLYILQLAVRVADGTKPALMDRGVKELMALKEQLKGVVDVDVVDRAVLDTRVR